MNFSIRGGAEIPTFCLTLRLRPEDSQDQNDVSNDPVFKAVWTAWGEKGFDTPRIVNKPDEDRSTTEFYSFSSRLQNVWIRETELSKEDADLSWGREGALGYIIYWLHSHPPHCFGFQIPD